MKPGDDITIQATVLRVDGNRVDTQTADGQLIQTDIANVNDPISLPMVVAGGKIESDIRHVSAPRIPVAGNRRRAA